MDTDFDAAVKANADDAKAKTTKKEAFDALLAKRLQRQQEELAHRTEVLNKRAKLVEQWMSSNCGKISPEDFDAWVQHAEQLVAMQFPLDFTVAPRAGSLKFPARGALEKSATTAAYAAMLGAPHHQVNEQRSTLFVNQTKINPVPGFKKLSVDDPEHMADFRRRVPEHFNAIDVHNKNNPVACPKPSLRSLVEPILWKTISRRNLHSEHRTKAGEPTNDEEIDNYLLDRSDYAGGENVFHNYSPQVTHGKSFHTRILTLTN